MLYRKRRTMSPLAAALIAAVVALAAGFAIGRATAPRPAFEEYLRPADAAVRAAQGGLEIVALEYPRAAAGATASRDASARAVRDALESLDAQSRVLRVLSPAAYGDARAELEALAGRVAAGASEAQVNAQLERARAALRALRPPL